MAKELSLILSFLIVAAVVDNSHGAANIIDVYKNVVFDYAIMKNQKPVVVLYYSSSRCTACKWSIKPMLEKMTKRKSNSLYLAFVDFDVVPELEVKHGITVLPTTRVLYKGDIVDEYEGLSWSALVPLVNNAAKIS